LDRWLKDNPEYFLLGIWKEDYAQLVVIKLGVSNLILTFSFPFDIDPLYLISYIEADKAMSFHIPEESKNSRQIRLFENLRDGEEVESEGVGSLDLQ